MSLLLGARVVAERSSKRVAIQFRWELIMVRPRMEAAEFEGRERVISRILWNKN